MVRHLALTGYRMNRRVKRLLPRLVKMLREGRSNDAIAAALEVWPDTVARLVGRLTAGGFELPDCNCGLRRGHAGACRGYGLARVSEQSRAEVENLARGGLANRLITKRAGVPIAHVTTIVRELIAREGNDWKCPCGRPRAHKGPCWRDDLQGEIRRRALAGQSARKITREMGVGAVTSLRHAAAARADAGKKLKPCKCGRPLGHPGGCRVNSPSQLPKREIDRIVRLARARKPLLVIQERTGHAIGTVRKYAQPVLAEMHLSGILCGCGQRLNHNGVCAFTFERGQRRRGPKPIPQELRGRIRNALLNGDPVVHIRRALPIPEDKVLRVLRAMTPSERHQRAVIVYRRVRQNGERAHGEALFDRVRAAIPHSLEKSLRDEVVSELCLALLQGDLTIEQIEAQSRAFVGRAYGQWASSFGPRSLDEVLGDDTDLTLGDLIDDTTTSDMLEQLTIGEQL